MPKLGRKERETKTRAKKEQENRKKKNVTGKKRRGENKFKIGKEDYLNLNLSNSCPMSLAWKTIQRFFFFCRLFPPPPKVNRF